MSNSRSRCQVSVFLLDGLEFGLSFVVTDLSCSSPKPSSSKAASVLSLDDSEKDVKIKKKDIE